MAYIILHPNEETADSCLIKTINKHIKKEICSLEEVCQDPDFCIIEKEDKGNIKIEQIKHLQKKLLYTPFDKSKQFGIIKNAHLMTQEAQNALLKTLEECNENTIMILTITNENSVLETILSRCTRIYPEKERVGEEVDTSFVETFLNKPIYEQINNIDEMVKEKKHEEFLDGLLIFFRKKHSEAIKKNQNPEKEKDILKTITEAKNRIKRNVNPRIALEYVCFKINHN